MKNCTACQESFADKFAFCPICGSPLNSVAPEPVAPSPAEELNVQRAVMPEQALSGNAAQAAAADFGETLLRAPRPAVSTATDDAAVHHNGQATQQFQAGQTVADYQLAAEPESVARDDGAPANVTPFVAEEADANGQAQTAGAFMTDENIPNETSNAASAADGAAHRRHAPVGEFHLTIMEDKSLLARLGQEVRAVAHNSQLSFPEFKRDPFGFTKRLVGGYGRLLWGFVSRPTVAIALLASIFSVGLLVVGVMVLESRLGGGGQGVSRGTVIAIAGGALLLVGGLFAAWLTRDRATTSTGFDGGNNTTYAESGSSYGDLAATLIAFFVIVGVVGGLFFYDRYRPVQVAKNTEEQLTIEQIIDTKDIPKEEEKPKKEGAAGNDKGKGGGSKEKQEKPQGGGGGGRENEPKPPSPGKLPVASLDKPIVSPSVNPPPPRPPLLAVPPTVRADPKLFPPDTRNIPFGTPGATGKEPSPGAGTGSGMGGGTGSGVGTGDGSGVGAGRGYNTGGGDAREGGGGRGGGGDGVDTNKIYTGGQVTSKAVITAKPEPQYTEEARKNQVQGTVTLRVALMANGSVGSIRAVSSLPSGLTEKAIAAARGIRFRPAQKSGTAVSQWIQVEYNFNLY